MSLPNCANRQNVPALYAAPPLLRSVHEDDADSYSFVVVPANILDVPSNLTTTAAPTAAAKPAAPNPTPAPKAKPQVKKESESKEPSFIIEGNSLYGDVSSTPIQVEVISGLESTSITNIQLKAEDKKEDEETSALPDQFAIETGEGEITVPDSIDTSMSLAQILSFARKFSSTDIYLYANRPIVIRQSGVQFDEIYAIKENVCVLVKLHQKNEEEMSTITESLTKEQQAEFMKDLKPEILYSKASLENEVDKAINSIKINLLL